MRFPRKTILSLLTTSCLILSLAAVLVTPAAAQSASGPFQLTSSTFTNGSTLPISTINNIVQNGVNACSINGSTGGNESPELSWTNTPARTQSFVVVLYDVTASFTHWGMYNIPATATGLPQNAGAAGSPYGTQILNDFENAFAYGGPCPPDGYVPYVHHYVFTVYALDTTLLLPGTPNFPSNSETLYHALINAGRYHHILASASLLGLYSTTPGKQD